MTQCGGGGELGKIVPLHRATEELLQIQGARLPMWKERRIPEVL